MHLGNFAIRKIVAHALVLMHTTSRGAFLDGENFLMKGTTMVKCHRHTGKPRHFRSNQRRYATMKNGYADVGFCNTCDFRGRSSGDRRFDGRSIGAACFNKASKMYMMYVRAGDRCSCYKLRMD